MLLGLLLVLCGAGGAYLFFPGEFSDLLSMLSGGVNSRVIVTGSKVFGSYTVKNAATGELLMDTGRGRQRVGLVVGNGEMLPEIEKALMGKTAGFSHSIRMSLSDLRKSPMGAQIPQDMPFSDDVILEIQGTVVEVQN